jgi:DNA-binding NtrC family response regulator
MAVILIVEDEDQVRVLAGSILTGHGHTCLSAGTFDQAIALLDNPQTNILDLLFSNLGLGKDLHAGLRVAQQAISRFPELPVLYTTAQGVTDGMRAMFVEHSGFIAKPYTAQQLTIAVGNLLAEKTARPRA